MADIRGDVDQLRFSEHNRENDSILNWLTRMDYTAQQNDFVRRCQEGTGQWLLNSTQFKSWLNHTRQTLFCPGIPGAGKTILTSIVVQHIYTLYQRDHSIGLAYIYCNFRQQDQQKPTDILASILKQLVQRQPSMLQYIRDLYDQHKDHQTRPSFGEILRAIYSVSSQFSKIFIIIDAVDEWGTIEGGYKKTLPAIFDLQMKTGANLFATSRINDDIAALFQGAPSLQTKPIRATEDDIARYIDGQLPLLPSDILDDPLKIAIKSKIIQAVDGMYVYLSAELINVSNLTIHI